MVSVTSPALSSWSMVCLKCVRGFIASAARPNPPPLRASRLEHLHSSSFQESDAPYRNKQQHGAGNEDDQSELYSNKKEGLQIRIGAGAKNEKNGTADAERRAANYYRYQPRDRAHPRSASVGSIDSADEMESGFSSPALPAPILLCFPLHRRGSRVLHFKPIGRAATAIQ
jgi:hypothetical protein